MTLAPTTSGLLARVIEIKRLLRIFSYPCSCSDVALGCLFLACSLLRLCPPVVSPNRLLRKTRLPYSHRQQQRSSGRVIWMYCCNTRSSVLAFPLPRLCITRSRVHSTASLTKAARHLKSI